MYKYLKDYSGEPFERGRENAYKRLIFLESNEIDIKDMKNYLVSLLRSDAQKILRNNSELKRLIRIYDFVKYK